jgi:GGDEF domain-containing protein
MVKPLAGELQPMSTGTIKGSGGPLDVVATAADIGVQKANEAVAQASKGILDLFPDTGDTGNGKGFENFVNSTKLPDDQKKKIIDDAKKNPQTIKQFADQAMDSQKLSTEDEDYIKQTGLVGAAASTVGSLIGGMVPYIVAGAVVPEADVAALVEKVAPGASDVVLPVFKDWLASKGVKLTADKVVAQTAHNLLNMYLTSALTTPGTAEQRLGQAAEATGEMAVPQVIGSLAPSKPLAIAVQGFLGGGASAISQMVKNGKIDWGEVAKAGGMQAIFGAMGGGVSREAFGGNLTPELQARVQKSYDAYKAMDDIDKGKPPAAPAEPVEPSAQEKFDNLLDKLGIKSNAEMKQAIHVLMTDKARFDKEYNWNDRDFEDFAEGAAAGLVHKTAVSRSPEAFNAILDKIGVNSNKTLGKLIAQSKSTGTDIGDLSYNFDKISDLLTPEELAQLKDGIADEGRRTPKPQEAKNAEGTGEETQKGSKGKGPVKGKGGGLHLRDDEEDGVETEQGKVAPHIEATPGGEPAPDASLGKHGYGNKAQAEHDVAEVFNNAHSGKAEHGSVAVIDMTNLGEANNQLGHETTNSTVIEPFAKILAKHIQALGGTISKTKKQSRTGGDEYQVAADVRHTELTKALDAAKEEMQKYAERTTVKLGDGTKVKLSELTHPKHDELPTGSGNFTYGVVDVKQHPDAKSYRDIVNIGDHRASDMGKAEKSAMVDKLYVDEGAIFVYNKKRRVYQQEDNLIGKLVGKKVRAGELKKGKTRDDLWTEAENELRGSKDYEYPRPFVEERSGRQGTRPDNEGVRPETVDGKTARPVGEAAAPVSDKGQKFVNAKASTPEFNKVLDKLGIKSNGQLAMLYGEETENPSRYSAILEELTPEERITLTNGMAEGMQNSRYPEHIPGVSREEEFTTPGEEKKKFDAFSGDVDELSKPEDNPKGVEAIEHPDLRRKAEQEIERARRGYEYKKRLVDEFGFTQEDIHILEEGAYRKGGIPRDRFGVEKKLDPEKRRIIEKNLVTDEKLKEGITEAEAANSQDVSAEMHDQMYEPRTIDDVLDEMRDAPEYRASQKPYKIKGGKSGKEAGKTNPWYDRPMKIEENRIIDEYKAKSDKEMEQQPSPEGEEELPFSAPRAKQEDLFAGTEAEDKRTPEQKKRDAELKTIEEKRNAPAKEGKGVWGLPLFKDKEIPGTEQQSMFSAVRVKVDKQAKEILKSIGEGKTLKQLGVKLDLVDARELTEADHRRMGTSENLVRRISKLFGKSVSFFKTTKGILDGTISRNGHILLNVDTSVRGLNVIGHEILHHLKTERRDLYDALANSVVKNTDWPGFLKDYNDRVLKGEVRKLSQEDVREEFVGDLMGDFLGEHIDEKGFWKALGHDLSEDEVKQIQSDAKEIADGFKKTGGQMDYASARFLKNAVDVKSALMDAVKEYAGYTERERSRNAIAAIKQRKASANISHDEIKRHVELGRKVEEDCLGRVGAYGFVGMGGLMGAAALNQGKE